jgi:hypothetical protein
MRWFSRKPARLSTGRHTAPVGVPVAAVPPPLSYAVTAPVLEPAEAAQGAESADWAELAPSQTPPESGPDLMAQPLAAAAVRPPYQSGVHLGFVDGSLLELPASDPWAPAFRALASTLTQGHR